MRRVCLVLAVSLCGMGMASAPTPKTLGMPALYCGHLGERNRIGDRIECAVGPHQHSLEPYPFNKDTMWVEDDTGTKVDGAITRDAYSVTFIGKGLFIAKKQYRLRFDLSALNKKQRRKLRLTWDTHLDGVRSFCFKGMETIEPFGIGSAYANRPERGHCK